MREMSSGGELMPLVQGSVPTSVALIAPSHAQLRPNDEISISYGDKSNEELLLRYGKFST